MIKSPSDILIATSNEGKCREITRALNGLPLKLRTLNDFPSIEVIEEKGETYEENAVAKAVGYAKQSGLYVIADDSGLEVDALDSRPGYRSARYGGVGLSDVERNQTLLKTLARIDAPSRAARFISVAVLAKPSEVNLKVPHVLAIKRGSCEGRIAMAALGDHGFGYDAIFIPEGYSESFGQLPASTKDQISHRARAILQIRAVLKGQLGLT